MNTFQNNYTEWKAADPKVHVVWFHLYAILENKLLWCYFKVYTYVKSYQIVYFKCV